MARGKTASPIVSPNLGLFLGQSPLTIPLRGLKDGQNFRIKQGRLSNLNLGWQPYFSTLNDAFRKVYLLFLDVPNASTDIKEFGAGRTDNHNWTAAGDAEVSTAGGSGALVLDGIGDWITHAHHADFVLGSDSWAIEVFATPAGNGTAESIAGKAESALTAAVTEWFIARLADDTVQAVVSDGTNLTTLTSTNLLQTPGSGHIMLTYDGTNLRLYLNGALEDTQPFTGPVNSNASADLRVGAAGESTTDPFEGTLSGFSISVGTARQTGASFTVEGEHLARFNGPMMLQDSFFVRGQDQIEVYGTTTDIYRRDPGTRRLLFITPVYTTGTVEVSGTAVTGTGTAWLANAKEGDEIQFRGSVPSTHPTGPWYTIAAVGSDTGITLESALTEAGGTLGAGTDYTIRRRLTGQIDEPWDVETFVNPDDGVGDDLYVITNGADSVVSWDGIDDSAIYHPELGFIAKRIIAWKNFMVYGNLVTTGGNILPLDIVNSDVGKPFDVVNGLAGQYRVNDDIFQIIELEDLGDNLVVYTERSVTNVQFVGDPVIFTFRDASSGIGPFASRTIADFGDFHEFLGADTQYLFDGVAVTEIGSQVWREVLRQRDPTRNQHAFAHFDEENGDLLWVVPLTTDEGSGDAMKPAVWAYVEHYLEEVGDRTPSPFSKRRMPFVSSGYGVTQGVLTFASLPIPWEDANFRWNESFLFSAFPLNLMGTEDGRVMVINTAQDGDGALLPSFVQFGRRVLGDWRMRGMLKRVYPFSTFLPGQLTITVAFYNQAAGLAASTHTVQFNQEMGPDKHFAVIYRRGRFFEVQFGTPGHGWQLDGYDTDAVFGGERG